MERDHILQTDLDQILEHTRDLWTGMSGGRIFITGGTGFFGRWLLESFIWARDRLNIDISAVVLSRKPEAFMRKAPHLSMHPAIQFHIGDVRTFDYPLGNFSHVIHAATDARASTILDSPLEMFETIVLGTRHVLEFAKKCGVQKFLLVSSGAIYGIQPPQITHLAEDHVGAPNSTAATSAYGEGKRAAEVLAAIYQEKYKVGAKIARCFAFIGPFLPLDAHFAAGNFIGDGLRGKPIRVMGDGTAYRSYLYAADLTIWLWHILMRGKTCYPYNVGSEEAVSIASLAHMVAHSFSPAADVAIDVHETMPGRPADRYVPSVVRARHDLGLTQIVGMQESIERTVRWHQAVASRA